MIRSRFTSPLLVAAVLTLSLTGGEAAVAVPHPISADVAAAQIASCLGTFQPERSGGPAVEVRDARAMAVSAGRHRLIIDARFTAYGASYGRRLSCTTDAAGAVIDVQGRPLALR